jgi:hypothetical protein
MIVVRERCMKINLNTVRELVHTSHKCGRKRAQTFGTALKIEERTNRGPLFVDLTPGERDFFRPPHAVTTGIF